MEINKNIEEVTKKLLKEMGEDPEREGLLKTPYRVAKSWSFLTSGYKKDLDALVNKAIFHEDYDEMVLIKDIEYYSMCEHHFLPFHGEAHVGYIPDGRVVGISKLARVVEGFARRPQLQERLTSQVAETIMNSVQPDGVAVVIEAEHLCMTMRGVRKPGSRMVTSAMRGQFKKSDVTRSEFLALVQSGRL